LGPGRGFSAKTVDEGNSSMIAAGIGTILIIFSDYLKLMTGFPSFQPEDVVAEFLH
jgi:hypothetical protein